MGTKHLFLDQELFKWMNEVRVGISVPLVFQVLGIQDKAERRHINRRFLQLRARDLITLTHATPTQFYKINRQLPQDTTKSGWEAKPPSITSASTRVSPIELPDEMVSIPASTSDEFKAKGGHIQILSSNWGTAPSGSRPTGYGFSFTEDL